MTAKILLAAVAFLYWISLYIYVPTLPTYVQSKTHNLAMVGIVLSMYGLWQAIVRLPIGIASDWIGRRKPFVFAGLLLAGLGAWLIGTADETSGLLVGRAVTGLAAGAWVPLVVAFSSLFPARDAVRATAILTVVNSVGRISATSVTGSLNQWAGYSMAFFLASGAAILGVFFLLLTREKRRPPVRPSLKGVGRLITRRDVLLPALLAAVSQYANWTTTFGFIPILSKDLGGSDMALSALLTMHIGVVLLGNLFASVTANRIGSRRLVYLGIGLLSFGMLLAALAQTLPILFAAQFFIGFAQGASYPVLMGLSIKYVADSERTTAMGLHQSVYALGMFAGPWLSGILAGNIGIQSTFVITALFCLALGVFGASKLERNVPDQPAPQR